MKIKYLSTLALVATISANAQAAKTNDSFVSSLSKIESYQITRGEPLLRVIIEFIADIKGIDEEDILPQSTLRGDLGMDSLERLQLYQSLIDLLDVTIENTDDAFLITVQDVHDFVHPQLYN